MSRTFIALGSICLLSQLVTYVSSAASSCRFAPQYQCEDFKDRKKVDSYLSNVMKWEGKFAQPGIGYDLKSGYTYDGHPLEYGTGNLYGEPHLFSAPSKESIHLGILALALEGNKHALEFIGGVEKTLSLLQLKINGYLQFNASYPGYGCFTPWVEFDDAAGTFIPIESWTKPYHKVPGLDNGEWFWSIYAIAHLLQERYVVQKPQLTKQWQSFMKCQKENAKTIFYRGDGNVSATVYILNPSITPTPENYIHADGWLNDPYEGETLTQMLYLFSSWNSNEERELLWTTKRGLFEKLDYLIPTDYQRKEWGANKITVQKGWWFSTHEQWKTLLLPYLSNDLPLVKKVFRNAEKARVMDAYINKIPGLMASINDVTNGSQEIPDYASACGIAELSFEKIDRRDLLTPYGSYGLFLHQPEVGFCWYNTMLQGPRMQSAFGSTEAINANGTEISPLTTWDSKITTVLAMLGGIGHINKQALSRSHDKDYNTAYRRFVYVVDREHSLLFGKEQDVLGDDIPFQLPSTKVPTTELTDWALSC